MRVLCYLLFILITGSYVVRSAEVVLVDLTHKYDENTFYFPGTKILRYKSFSMYRGKVPFLNFWLNWNWYWFSTQEHSGTHMDAPVHMKEGQWHVDEIPVKNFFGEGVMIDISERAQADPDTTLSVNDVINNETEFGQIPDGSIVIVNTGNWRHYKNRPRYIGTDTENPTKLHFPGIGPETAKWIVDNRNIKGIGLDTVSLDSGQNTHRKSHQIFFAENIFGLENLTNLDQLPARGFTVTALPIHLGRGTGGPVRVIAHVTRES